MIELSFENIKYGSYPQNSDFNDLPIEYEKKLFTKLPIDSLTDNTVERLKVISIERLFDNIIYESDPLNANFYYLPFDCDERLITRRRIYFMNGDIIFRLKMV